MSKADELFLKAGFDEKEEGLSKIRYYVDLPLWKPSIVFNKRRKTIKCDFAISTADLKAINEKIKELRLGVIKSEDRN